jgi:hypothetical protein
VTAAHSADASTPTFQLVEDEQGRLILRRAGEEDAKDVRLRRSFPWSKPHEFLSIRSSEGKELVLIDDLRTLDAPTCQLVDRWLASHSFVPRITRIDDVDVRFGYQQWKVHTDRGRAEFRVQEREDIRFLSDGRFSVRDADGNIYELPRLDELDAHSRHAVEALL